jgi:hypothetical protein
VVARFVGGCFAAVAAGCSLSRWMLCHHGLVSCVGKETIALCFFIAGTVVGLGYWGRSLFLCIFLCIFFLCLFQVTHYSLSDL